MGHTSEMRGSMEMPVPFTWGHVTAWSWSATISLAVLASVIAYVIATRRWSSLTGAAWSKKRTAAFFVASGLVILATQSVVGVYDMVLFSAHMVQHLLLVMIAAGCYAMSAPLELTQGTLPGAPGRLFGRMVDSKVGEVIGHPIFGFVTYAVFITIVHLTSLFNQMLLHMWVHRAEQVGFLLIGYLFWRPVVGIEPSRHPLMPGLRMVYLALAVPVDTFVGLALVMAGHVQFNAYSSMGRTWGPSIITDIKTGGAIMWIGGDFLMLLAMIPVAFLWMRDEESKTKELDARLDAEAAARGASGMHLADE